VLSQVVLSLVLPIPRLALVKFTARRDAMGEFANSRLTNVLAVTAAGFGMSPQWSSAARDRGQNSPDNFDPVDRFDGQWRTRQLGKGIIQSQRRSV